VYHVQQRDDASIVEVTGELNALSSEALASAIALAESSSDLPIIVSLTRCSSCGSSGLRVLVSAKNRVRGRLLVIVPTRSRLKRVFDATGLTKRLAPFTSLEKALGRPTSTAVRAVGLKAHDTRNNIFGPPPRRVRSGAAPITETASHGNAYANIIPMMKTLAANGLGLREIAAQLDADGYRTVHGDRWCAVAVSRVLSRP
jgi:anti-anti-sigma factor